MANSAKTQESKIEIDLEISDLIENNIHFLERDEYLRRRVREEVDGINKAYIEQYREYNKAFLIGAWSLTDEYFNFWVSKEDFISIFGKEKVNNIKIQLNIIEA